MQVEDTSRSMYRETVGAAIRITKGKEKGKENQKSRESMGRL